MIGVAARLSSPRSARQRTETVEDRHLQIQNDEIGRQFPCVADRFEAIARFPDLVTQALKHHPDKFRGWSPYRLLRSELLVICLPCQDDPAEA